MPWFLTKQATFCRFLRAIAIPGSVQIIEEESFSNCTSLEIVEFSPESKMTSFDPSAFCMDHPIKIEVFNGELANFIRQTYQTKILKEKTTFSLGN